MSRQVVLVTGSSRGIGFHLAKALLQKGSFNVWASTASRPVDACEPLLELQDEYGSQHLRIVHLDVSNDDSVSAAIRTMKEDAFPGSKAVIDLLINNAGIASKDHPNDSLTNSDPNEFLHILNVNVVGVHRMIRGLLPLFPRHSQGVQVVNIGSSLASIATNTSGNAAMYRCSKAALNQLSRCWALQNPSIRFVTICPGWVQTDMGNSGGRLAEREPAVAAQQLVELIQTLAPESSGKFLSYDGSELPF